MTATRVRRNAEPGLSLPHTGKLLVEGGDARIVPERDSGRNKYGCSALPDPDLLSLGSSTASGISGLGFAAADRLRNRLSAATETASMLYARELGRIRRELVQLCGVADIAGLETVMAASGTDAHLIAAELMAGTEALPALAIMVDAAETGSGVPAALAGRHFSTRAALGQKVGEGTAIAGGGTMTVATVPVRLSDGMPRPVAEVDAEVESLALAAAAQGRRVVLVPVDVSKTGLIAPSLGCVLSLRQRLPELLDVLMDACQFRIASPTLRAYLEHGFVVALTGSKFVAGPSFSGVLLIPGRVAQRLRGQPVPRALAAYSARADWPDGWDVRHLEDAANFGLLLRWEAALAELRVFFSLAEESISGFLQAFALAVVQRLTSDPAFALLPAPALDRRPLTEAQSWDRIQTIFPFLLLHPKTRVPLSREQTARIYQLLQLDLTHAGASIGKQAALRCQLGQPVACGSRDGMPVSALRLCASARLVAEAVSRNAAAAVIEQALAALDKTAQLVRAESGDSV